MDGLKAHWIGKCICVVVAVSKRWTLVGCAAVLLSCYELVSKGSEVGGKRAKIQQGQGSDPPTGMRLDIV